MRNHLDFQPLGRTVVPDIVNGVVANEGELTVEVADKGETPEPGELGPMIDAIPFSTGDLQLGYLWKGDRTARAYPACVIA